MELGYKRVSSDDQNSTRQLEGVILDRIFEDIASGKNLVRPELARCIEFLRPGDQLHVHSIDRLARSLMDLHQLVEQICSKGAVVHFVSENLTFATGNQNATDKLLFSILGAIAEFERNMIRTRQREGIDAARKLGKRFGRPSKISPKKKAAILDDFRQGASPSDISGKYRIGRTLAFAFKKEALELDVIHSGSEKNTPESPVEQPAPKRKAGRPRRPDESVRFRPCSICGKPFLARGSYTHCCLDCARERRAKKHAGPQDEGSG